MAEGRWRELHFFYRSNGRLERVAESADSSRETYGYDLAGNMVSATDGENHSVKYGYNPAGNLSRRTDASGNTEYFFYDVHGGGVASH